MYCTYCSSVILYSTYLPVSNSVQQNKFIVLKKLSAFINVKIGNLLSYCTVAVSYNLPFLSLTFTLIKVTVWRDEKLNEPSYMRCWFSFQRSSQWFWLLKCLEKAAMSLKKRSESRLRHVQYVLSLST